jgi:hypothetical protein
VSIFDEYSRNARLKPAFFCLLPLAVVLASYGKSYSLATGLVSLSSFSGLTFFLSQVGRDFGKKKEPLLFKRWGGKPSVLKMRHRDGTLNTKTRGRYHEHAAALLGRRVPTAEEELIDVAGSDEVYESFGNLLQEKTRDTKKFRLLFLELMNYGFRRNLWGLKPIGIFISTGCILVLAFRILSGLRYSLHINPTLLLSEAGEVLLLGVWLFIVTPQWVKLTADAYGERLLASCEVVAESHGAKKAVGQSKGAD